MDRTEHGTWRKHRVTGTDMAVIMNGGPAAWNTLAKQLREGKPFYGPSNGNVPVQLRWGWDHEEQAAEQFWLRHPEYDIQDPRFMVYPEFDPIRHEHCGCSPDRILYGRLTDPPVGVLEIKCPYSPNIHLSYMAGFPREHEPQVRWEMHVAQADEAWFVTFDPRAEAPHNYAEFHVQLCAEYEKKMLERLDLFLEGYLSGEDFTTSMLKPKDAATLRGMF